MGRVKLLIFATAIMLSPPGVVLSFLTSHPCRADGLVVIDENLAPEKYEYFSRRIGALRQVPAERIRYGAANNMSFLRIEDPRFCRGDYCLNYVFLDKSGEYAGVLAGNRAWLPATLFTLNQGPAEQNGINGALVIFTIPAGGGRVVRVFVGSDDTFLVILP